MLKKYTIINQGQLHAEYEEPTAIPFKELPDSAYIYARDDLDSRSKWYRKDVTPVLDSDVPKECKAWLLLLGGP